MSITICDYLRSKVQIPETALSWGKNYKCVIEGDEKFKNKTINKKLNDSLSDYIEISHINEKGHVVVIVYDLFYLYKIYDILNINIYKYRICFQFIRNKVSGETFEISRRCIKKSGFYTHIFFIEKKKYEYT